jgi:branched-chain amino acid transport system permease protein
MSTTEAPLGAQQEGDSAIVTGRAGRWRAYLPVALTAAVLTALPLLLGDERYYIDLATLALVYAGYAIGFNIIFGNTNQLFLCMGAFAGVGAYGTAVLGNEVGLPMPVGVVISVCVTAAFGATFSLVSVRRRLDVIFVGIVTLTFSLVFINLLLGQREFTGGETGMILDYDPGPVGERGLVSYFIFLVVLVAFLTIYRWVQRSYIGWAFRALRDDELAAELSGIDVARYKMIAGAMGSAMVGLVGALYAHYEGFFSPTTFELGQVDVPVLVMLAFGGIGSLLGPVVGATVFTVVDAVLRPLAQLRTAVYGVILLVLFLGFRNGVVPTINDLARWLARRRARRS